MLGHDLEMSCTKFHENRLIIDGEIDEKHALQIIVLKTLVVNEAAFSINIILKLDILTL